MYRKASGVWTMEEMAVTYDTLLVSSLVGGTMKPSEFVRITLLTLVSALWMHQGRITNDSWLSTLNPQLVTKIESLRSRNSKPVVTPTVSSHHGTLLNWAPPNPSQFWAPASCEVNDPSLRIFDLWTMAQHGSHTDVLMNSPMKIPLLKWATASTTSVTRVGNRSM